MHQYGSIGNSRIDFQNVENPDPTYYRNSTQVGAFQLIIKMIILDFQGDSPENALR
jgi:hypothetical protein